MQGQHLFVGLLERSGAGQELLVDFGDGDTIEAILAGGMSERLAQEHQNDRARLWAADEREPGGSIQHKLNAAP